LVRKAKYLQFLGNEVRFTASETNKYLLSRGCAQCRMLSHEIRKTTVFSLRVLGEEIDF
jgi:hypothetical protein